MLIAALAACTLKDVVALQDGGAPPYCAGTGPVILRAQGRAVCTGALAASTFDHAVCTCGDASGPLVTDSFDSTQGPYTAPGGSAAPIGVDGTLMGDSANAGGKLTVAGALGANVASLHAADTLAIAGPFTTTTATVDRDARIGGNIDAIDSFAVAGMLTVQSGAMITGTVTGNPLVMGAVVVTAPCDCTQVVDLPTLVPAHATDNQDALVGLTPDSLVDYAGDMSFALPCGIYYLRGISTSAIGGNVTLSIQGRVAVLVDGDVNENGTLTITLDTADAELDLLIVGSLMSSQQIAIGDAAKPAHTRVYVGGDVVLSGDLQLAANFYARNANLQLSASADAFGSLFVGGLTQSTPLKIHYDTDVVNAGVHCLP